MVIVRARPERDVSGGTMRREAGGARVTVLVVALAVSTALFTPTRSGATARSAAAPHGILRYGLDLTPAGAGGAINLDPAHMTGSPFAVTPTRLVYDNLVRTSADGTARPGLAVAW